MKNERLRNLIEQAHMAGQIEAGIDPSYSNARVYTTEAVKGCTLGDVIGSYRANVTTLDKVNHTVLIPNGLDATETLDYLDEKYGVNKWISWSRA